MQCTAHHLLKRGNLKKNEKNAHSTHRVAFLQRKKNGKQKRTVFQRQKSYFVVIEE